MVPADLIEVGVMLVAAAGAATVDAVQRWRRRRRPARVATQLERRYEWRNAAGAVSSYFHAGNACEFWLRSHASGAAPTGTEPTRPIWLHVASTGERVFVQGEPGVRARLNGDEGVPWYGMDGRETRAKREAA